MTILILKVLCVTIVALAVISDLYTYKVKNIITVSFAIIGILYNIAFFGLSNLNTTFFGLALPFIILFPLYLLKMLGAGDIKLFCAIGAVVGLRSVAYTIAYSYISGAIIAIMVMVFRKNSLERFRYFVQYIKNCYLCMQLLPYGDLKDQEQGSKMHFTIPIAFGMMIVLLRCYK